MSKALTTAMRRLLQHVADNPGRLRDHASRRDFPVRIAWRDTIHRAGTLGFLDPPMATPTRTYELTPAGRQALTQEQTDER